MSRKSAPAFVDAVLFAEFDIDKGSVLRVQYPRQISEDEGLLAELMLPEGVHNRPQDWTLFMLNRPSQLRSDEQMKQNKRWPVHAYKYDTTLQPAEWVLASAAADGACATHWASIEVPTEASGGVIQPALVIELENDEQIRLICHDELQYSALQADFASMYSVEGDALGLHFRSADQQAGFKATLDAVAADDQSSCCQMLWCLNHVANRRDSTVRRGAQVKSLAVCSRFQFVHVWKPLLLLAVDRMYSLSTGASM
jgi:hypothetical protein